MLLTIFDYKGFPILVDRVAHGAKCSRYRVFADTFPTNSQKGMMNIVKVSVKGLDCLATDGLNGW